MSCQNYLLQDRPSEYSYADHTRDSVTALDGDSNPVALKNFREIEAWRALIVHLTTTGVVKSADGTATVDFRGRLQSQKPHGSKSKPASHRPAGHTGRKSRQSALCRHFLGSPGRLLVVPLYAAQYKFLTGA